MKHQPKHFDGSSLETIVMSDMTNRAQDFDQEWRTRRTAILADKMLSAEGQRVMLASLDNERVAAVAGLQEEAQRYAAARQQVLAGKLERAAADELARRRALLGDAVIVDLWARRLASMDGLGMRQALDSTVGWEREIVRNYALATLDARRTPQGDFTDAGDIQAWQALQPPEDDEVSNLRQAVRAVGDEGWIEALDLDARRRYISSTFRIPYEATLQRAADADAARAAGTA